MASPFKKLKLDESLENESVSVDNDYDSLGDISSSGINSDNEIESNYEIDSCNDIDLSSEVDAKNEIESEEEFEQWDDIGSNYESSLNNLSLIEACSEVDSIHENDWGNDDDIDANDDFDMFYDISSSNVLDSKPDIEPFDEKELGEIDSLDIDYSPTKIIESKTGATHSEIEYDGKESGEMDSEKESGEIDSEKESGEIDSKEESGEIDSERESGEIDSEEESGEIDSKDEVNAPNLNDSSIRKIHSLMNTRPSTIKEPSFESQIENERIANAWRSVSKRKEEREVKQITPAELHHWGTMHNYKEKSATLKKLMESGRPTVEDPKYYLERVLRELGLEFRIIAAPTKTPVKKIWFYKVLQTDFSFMGMGESDEEAKEAAAKKGLEFLKVTST